MSDFTKHLDHASRVVASWPPWKQTLLGGSPVTPFIRACQPSAQEIEQRASGECPRKTGLKNGIRQLTTEQIQRTLIYDRPMALDHGNFVNGLYCPLAIGVGLDQTAFKEPTNDKVAGVLTLMGYKVNNTRGVPGSFYRDNRAADYFTAAREVLWERGWRCESSFPWLLLKKSA